MCNHYHKKREVIGWAVTKVPRAVMGYTPQVEFAEHTFPKYPAPVMIQEHGTRTLVEMRWGVQRFIGQGKTKPVTNARNDKLLSRTWKACAEQRRCLIPATGYFEPGLGPVGAKGEMFFRVKEWPMFFFAGLWDINPDGAAFTMVTTEPNDYVRPYHDRMPVVLAESDWELWLGDEPLSVELLNGLCRGLPSEALQHEELAAKLKVTRPGPMVKEPPPPPPTPEQGDLFGG
jgi:putative SOS response-associated peptidase YedK